MKTLVRLMVAGAFVLAFSAAGYAQMQASPPTAPAAPAAPAAPKAKKAPMSAEDIAKSKECSAKADAQKLHGKARKEFRAKCKKGET